MQRQSGSTFLPLRVNSAGMIPLIFAFSIIILPATVASYFRNPLSDDILSKVARFFADTLDPVVDASKPARVLAAAWLGKTRLIDNVAV